MQLKIQCPCGAKHVLDITPEMAANGVRFVCTVCGADRSAEVDQVVQQQFGLGRTTSAGAAAPAALADMPAACLKHPGRFVVEQCVVCGKPLCPVCMDETGYVCSVECRRRARREGIQVPVHAGQRGPAPRSYGRIVGRLVLGLVGLGLVALGVAAWYAWAGAKPRLVASVKLPPDSAASLARLIEPDQVAYCSGRQLKRFDLNAKREVWSVSLPETGPGSSAPGVFVQGQDLWVVGAQSLWRLDWATGHTNREIPFAGRLVSFQPSDTALVLVAVRRSGQVALTRVDLSTGLAQAQDVGRRSLGLTNQATLAPRAGRPRAGEPARTPFGRALGAAESIRDLNQARNQAIERALQETEAEPGSGEPAGPEAWQTEFLNAEANVAELTVRALDNPAPTATRSGGPPAAPAEDRYRVTLRRWLGAAASTWTGELSEPPALFVLPTVDLLIAGQTVRAFDKLNKPLWEARLGQPVAPQFLQPRIGLVPNQGLRGPCVQQGNGIYVFDQGSLQALDLMNGSVRWRLALAGIRQVQPDEHGMLYVVAGSAARPSGAVVAKVDPNSGKVLWRVQDRGLYCCATGRFVYAVSYQPGEPELAEAVPYLMLWRLDPKDGRVLWEHTDQRLPVGMDFAASRLLLRFADELQVWRFRSP